jgi:hypothetical protein
MEPTNQRPDFMPGGAPPPKLRLQEFITGLGLIKAEIEEIEKFLPVSFR